VNTNFYRAMTAVCAIIISGLIWLAAFVLKESIRVYSWVNLPASEWLVPGILLITAVPLTALLVTRMVPRLFNPENTAGIRMGRIFFMLAFFVVAAMGLLI